MIDLYTAATPNDHKVSIVIEKPGLCMPERTNPARAVQGAQAMLIR